MDKGEIGTNVWIGIVVLLGGFFISLIAFMGFVLENSAFTFTAGILLALLGIIIAISERLLL
ncbi:hypothetical protein A2819_00195 [Candidatus Azambacteria bacterium RIFCSPHIGHO2_01_FULL_40_24]|uniref:Uncharacterized protein n=1 Tax=Candidatus Azambacteria bacterium RIFCSPHIGHO2_01_FULL_40_24 TaxID=1797301 RepID=A0A1F5B3H3_9BACT|nr:hypothetical protein [Candidatus Woesearchaeota archaeon]OGD25172.1 MAG: hypothetical protein A2819_00195 [Candidatus Azambacteria bacterium RIFCSPHIGHO2_01_FULL_40_24]